MARGHSGKQRALLALAAGSALASSAAAAEADIGLRLYDGVSIASAAVQEGGPSPLKVQKGTSTYGVLLVPPADPDASNFMMVAPGGAVMAIKKYNPAPPCEPNTSQPWFHRGIAHAGACWYIAQMSVSCDTWCATHGGTHSATWNYAGSGGTDANCLAAADAIEPHMSANSGRYFQNAVTPDNANSGIGCYAVVIPILASHFNPSYGYMLRRATGGPTTGGATGMVARICACVK